MKRLLSTLLALVLIVSLFPVQEISAANRRCPECGKRTLELADHEDPTCEDDGYDWYLCSNCDYEETEYIDAVGHDYEEDGHEDATCEDWGYTSYTCTRCGDWYEEEDESPLGHDYVLISHEEATCQDWGYSYYECTRCGDGYEEEDEAPVDHDYVFWYHEDATCEEWGYDVYYCRFCDDESTENSEAPLGHDWVADDIWGNPRDGWQGHYYCSRCDEEKDLDSLTPNPAGTVYFLIEGAGDFYYQADDFCNILLNGLTYTNSKYDDFSTDEHLHEKYSYYKNNVLIVTMDVYDMQGNGDNTVLYTLYPAAADTYRLAVTSNDSEGGSTAFLEDYSPSVAVYRDTTLLETYQKPAPGCHWDVLSYNCATGTLTSINECGHDWETEEIWGNSRDGWFAHYYCSQCGEEKDDIAVTPDPEGTVYYIIEGTQSNPNEWCEVFLDGLIYNTTNYSNYISYERNYSHYRTVYYKNNTPIVVRDEYEFESDYMIMYTVYAAATGTHSLVLTSESGYGSTNYLEDYSPSVSVYRDSTQLASYTKPAPGCRWTVFSYNATNGTLSSINECGHDWETEEIWGNPRDGWHRSYYCTRCYEEREESLAAPDPDGTAYVLIEGTQDSYYSGNHYYDTYCEAILDGLTYTRTQYYDWDYEHSHYRVEYYRSNVLIAAKDEYNTDTNDYTILYTIYPEATGTYTMLLASDGYTGGTEGYLENYNPDVSVYRNASLLASYTKPAPGCLWTVFSYNATNGTLSSINECGHDWETEEIWGNPRDGWHRSYYCTRCYEGREESLAERDPAGTVYFLLEGTEDDYYYSVYSYYYSNCEILLDGLTYNRTADYNWDYEHNHYRTEYYQSNVLVAAKDEYEMDTSNYTVVYTLYTPATGVYSLSLASNYIYGGTDGFLEDYSPEVSVYRDSTRLALYEKPSPGCQWDVLSYNGATQALTAINQCGHDWEQGEEWDENGNVQHYCVRCDAEEYGPYTPTQGLLTAVLSWGAQPDDLDSHLLILSANREVYYGNKQYLRNNTKLADLDRDDTDGYGPETTTIYLPNTGVYRFRVEDYTNRYDPRSTALSLSGATVRVYQGGTQRAVYTVPRNVEGCTWNVFEYDSATNTLTSLGDLGHRWDTGELTPPTCTEAGYTVYTCVDCGASRTVVGSPAAGHLWVQTGVSGNPVEGFIAEFTCSVCDETKYEPVDDSTTSNSLYIVLEWGENPRDLDSHLILTDRNAEIAYYDMEYSEGGRLIADLDRDDVTSYGPETVTIYAPISGSYKYYVHDFTNSSSQTSTALANSGATVRVYKGSVLRETFFVPAGIVGCRWDVFQYDAATDTIIPLNVVDHAYEEINRTNPTCEDPGYLLLRCTDCGNVVQMPYADPLGHDWNDGAVTTAPTCTREGVLTYTCRNNTSHKYTEAIETVPHTPVLVNDRAATTTREGYTGDWICSSCQTLLEEGVVIPKLISDTVITVGTADVVQQGDTFTVPVSIRNNPGVGRIRFQLVYDKDYLELTSVSEQNGYDAWLGWRWNEDAAWVNDYDTDYDGEFLALSFAVKENAPVGYTQIYVSNILCYNEYGDQYTVDSEAGGAEISCLHIWDDGIILRQPTCAAEGETLYSCTRCGATRTEEIEKLPHETELRNGRAPECLFNGFTGDLVCKNCGKTVTAGETIPALGHGFGAWTVTTEPTCTEKGEETRYCSRCDAMETREAAALGHDLIDHDAKAPTCTEIGWSTYQTCSRCDYSSYAELSPLGHYLIDHEAKAPTCTEIGWNAYQTCSRCDYTTYVELPALGHDLIHHDAKAPTCTEIGWSAYQTCSRCDYSTYSELNPLGHDWSEWTLVTAPTVTENGLEQRTCGRCGEVETREVIAETVTVQFNANGGVVVPASTVILKGGKLYELPAPTYAGYRFLGWYTARNGGVPVTLEDTYLTDTEIFARWELIDSGRLILSAERARPSEEVTVSISIQDNPGIGVMRLHPEYDHEKLELIGFENAGLSDWNVSEYAIWLGEEDSFFNGVILKLKFKVKANAAEGDTAITVSYEEGDISNSIEELRNPSVEAGKVTIYMIAPGDITGDGKVNAMDLLRLKRVLAQEEGAVAVGSCDITGDGKVNALDLLRLKRYLAGEDVVIH